MTADPNFFQNVEKSVCAKAFGDNSRIKIPANQVCPRITRHGRQARIDANEFSSDKALFALIDVIRAHAGKIAADRARDYCDKDTNYTNCHEAPKAGVNCWIIPCEL
jgi:hypothetical protein